MHDHAPIAIPVPTPAQLAWQRLELGVFFHFGVNTFVGKEWTDGTVPVSAFDPSDLDADEWVRTAQDLGARYVVLTAKHHDGYCLWPTATTDYSVASSPWREGTGDVVAEVADACRRRGLGLGLYLSPWDRHADCYEDATAYDEFYLAQLRELCTGYGELTEIWFDGAGSAGRTYDWARIGELIHDLQPDAMVFNMGPATIRWIGNEDGLASDPCEYVTASTDLNNYDPDVVELADSRYLPPECDVSIRRGWFWHEDEDPKSLEHLLAIHDRSIGLGANLLLNIPPDRRGRIDERDAARVRELREALDARFAEPTSADLVAETLPEGVRIRATLPAPQELDHVELRERLEDGQRAQEHRVCLADGTELARGNTIGARRIHRLERAVRADELVIDVHGPAPSLEDVRVHHAAGAPVPSLPDGHRASTAAPED